MKPLFLLLTLAFLSGCDKSYTYVQYGKKFDGKTFNGDIVPYPSKTIKAASDAEAYKKALLTFGNRVLVSKRMLSEVADSNELRNYTPFPYGYELLTPDGKRVSSILEREMRLKVQEEAFDSLTRWAKLIIPHGTLSREEVLNHDQVK